MQNTRETTACEIHNPICNGLRRLIETAPAQNWTISSIAKQLTVSEATLRRQVSFEGDTVGGLLTDTRMTLAMTPLQSTDAPVSRITIDVEYESASHFAIRFRDRFGFPPTAIRGHPRIRSTFRTN